MQINIRKKYFFGILAMILVLAGAISAYAYNTNNPSYFGHTASEIDGIVANANHAVTADSATTCTTAMAAATCTTANYATTAGSATTATGANHAVTADYSNSAGFLYGSWNAAGDSWLAPVAKVGPGNAYWTINAGGAEKLYADYAGNTAALNCQICYRMGLNNCGTAGGPTTITSEVCAPVGSYGAWTDHANGNCIQMKLVCN